MPYPKKLGSWLPKKRTWVTPLYENRQLLGHNKYIPNFGPFSGGLRIVIEVSIRGGLIGPLQVLGMIILFVRVHRIWTSVWGTAAVGIAKGIKGIRHDCFSRRYASNWRHVSEPKKETWEIERRKKGAKYQDKFEALTSFSWLILYSKCLVIQLHWLRKFQTGMWNWLHITRATKSFLCSWRCQAVSTFSSLYLANFTMKREDSGRTFNQFLDLIGGWCHLLRPDSSSSTMRGNKRSYSSWAVLFGVCHISSRPLH
jgi:hypothetical protein